jgi:hypothetical protein
MLESPHTIWGMVRTLAALRDIFLPFYSRSFVSIRGPSSCPFAVTIRVHSRLLFVSIRGSLSRL